MIIDLCSGKSTLRSRGRKDWKSRCEKRWVHLCIASLALRICGLMDGVHFSGHWNTFWSSQLIKNPKMLTKTEHSMETKCIGIILSITANNPRSQSCSVAGKLHFRPFPSLSSTHPALLTDRDSDSAAHGISLTAIESLKMFAGYGVYDVSSLILWVCAGSECLLIISSRCDWINHFRPLPPMQRSMFGGLTQNHIRTNFIRLR